MLGGHLCFEGPKAGTVPAPTRPGRPRCPHPDDLAAFEQQKTGAIPPTSSSPPRSSSSPRHRTGSSLGLQIAVVAGIPLLMTIGVYGLVGSSSSWTTSARTSLQAPDASALRRALGARSAGHGAAPDALLALGRHHRHVHGRWRHLSTPALRPPPDQGAAAAVASPAWHGAALALVTLTLLNAPVGCWRAWCWCWP